MGEDKGMCRFGGGICGVLATVLWADAAYAATGGTVTVDGNTVSYWPSAKDAAYVEFQADTQGYRNTYLLDCEERRFIWTNNVRLATGQDTGNNAGAEWKELNPGSRLSNAVFQVACPQILASGEGRKSAAAGAPATMAGDRRVNVYGVGIQGALGMTQASNSAASQVASSGTVANAAAGVEPVADTSKHADGGHSIPKLQPIQLEASKLELPPAPSMVVGSGGAPSAASGNMATIAGGGAEPQGVAGQADKISVKDGSALSGTLSEGKVAFKSSLGKVEVNMSEIRSFSDGKLHLSDGTVLAGAFAGGAIQIAAGVGTLEVPADDIVAIVREGQREAGGGKEATVMLPPEVQQAIEGFPLEVKQAIKQAIEKMPPEAKQMLQEISSKLCEDIADDAQTIATWKTQGKTEQESQELYIDHVNKKGPYGIPKIDQNLQDFKQMRLNDSGEAVASVFSFLGSQHQLHAQTFLFCILGLYGIEVR